MSNIPHVQLLAPGLCGPLPDTQQIFDDARLKQCFSQLAKANVTTLDCNDLYSLLIDLFKLEKSPVLNRDNFPSAALSLLGYSERLDKKEHDKNACIMSKDDVSHLSLNDYCFLHADPVHLRAEMDHAVLVGTQDLNLSKLETKEFCETLHQHFKDDDVDVFAMDENHWYVRLKTPQDVCTVKLSDAVGRNVNFIMPSGKDEVYWKQFLNESQMLLHMHSNNEKRESRGQLPVNSVWVHGGGGLSGLHASGNSVSSVCADDVLLTGLAKYCQLPNTVGLDDVKTFYARIKDEVKPLLYIDSLLPWLNYTDTEMWQQQCESFYLLWLKPLLGMVKQGKMQLTLYPCNDKAYSFNRYSSYKFWRKAKIENYVSIY